MITPETMKYLADNYIYGIIGVSVVVAVVYILFSVRLVVTARRVGIDVCATAFIPGYNLILLVRKWILCIKNRASRRKSAPSYEPDEEFDL